MHLPTKLRKKVIIKLAVIFYFNSYRTRYPKVITTINEYRKLSEQNLSVFNLASKLLKKIRRIERVYLREKRLNVVQSVER